MRKFYILTRYCISKALVNPTTDKTNTNPYTPRFTHFALLVDCVKCYRVINSATAKSKIIEWKIIKC